MKIYHLYKRIGFVLGPLVFLILYNLPVVLLTYEADKVIAIGTWMIIWWVTEAVSISVTALIPLTFFPLLGIMDLKTVASDYGSPIVFLFFGGFVMALALEKVNLHKRIALNIIRITGTNPDKVILGFMISTGLLSMWISNTATTVVMLPIALSVIHLLINDDDGMSEGDKKFSLSILLGIAYAANLGGIATIIGTPPNTVLVGFLQNEYQMDISFGQWMLVGLPFSILMIGIAYFVLVKFLYPNNLPPIENSKQLINGEIAKLGPINRREKRVLWIFGITIFCWIFRVWINQYISFMNLSDTGISLLAAFVLFAFPFSFNRGEFTLEWKDTEKLPWGILLLFGGGLALASALSQVGIISMIGDSISNREISSTLLVAAILITVVLFATELMSNVALVAVFAPVVAGIALGIDLPMLYVLIPITMASSCAFMLPMATPPNAVVFASGHITVHEMARSGLVLNIIAIMLLVLMTKYYIPLIF